MNGLIAGRMSDCKRTAHRTARALVAMVFLSQVLPALLFAQEEQVRASIILSNDAGPYLQALAGIKASFLPNRGVRFSEYNLKTEHSSLIVDAVSHEKPQVLFVLGTPALTLAKEKFAETPTIFCMTLASKETSAANLTGVTLDIPLMEKLSKVREVAPDMKKIGIIHSAAFSISAQEVARLQESLGIKLVLRKIESEKSLPDALEDIQWQIDLLLMVPDSNIYSSHSVYYLLQESAKTLFPVVGLSSYYTKAGALFSIDCDYVDLGRQSAEIAMRVLAGEPPSGILPESPRRMSYSINTAVSKRMKIDISNETLKKAGEVFGQ